MKKVDFDLNKSAPNLRTRKTFSRSSTEFNLDMKPRKFDQPKEKTDPTKIKSYEELVALECRCKLA